MYTIHMCIYICIYMYMYMYMYIYIYICNQCHYCTITNVIEISFRLPLLPPPRPSPEIFSCELQYNTVLYVTKTQSSK